VSRTEFWIAVVLPTLFFLATISLALFANVRGQYVRP
jgi:hypothetical protein